jgi:lysozyme
MLAILGVIAAAIVALGGGFLWLANKISGSESDMWEPKSGRLAIVAAAVKRHWSLLWAARLIAKWEGFSSPAILDTLASPPVWTVFFGHTKYAGKPIPHEGMRGSRARGMRVLAHDARSSAAAVDRLVKHKLTVRQRMALIDLVYNCGSGVLEGTELVRCINEGRWQQAAVHLLEYDHAGGVVVEGLRRRRQNEAWLLLHPRRVSGRPRQKPDKKHRPHTRGERRPT